MERSEPRARPPCDSLVVEERVAEGSSLHGFHEEHPRLWNVEERRRYVDVGPVELVLAQAGERLCDDTAPFVVEPLADDAHRAPRPAKGVADDHPARPPLHELRLAGRGPEPPVLVHDSG
jgi:hypothetical protein